MTRYSSIVLLSIVLIFGCNSGGGSQADTPAPILLSSEYSRENPRNTSERWYEDNNLGQSGGAPIDFLSRMSAPDSWKTSREVMHVFYLRSATYKKHLQNNDAILTEMAVLFAQHNIALAIDDTSATWANAPHRNADLTFQSSIEMISHLKSSGFNLRYVSLQSVLSKPLKNANGEVLDYSDEQRFHDVLAYLNSVKPVYPEVSIGIIDALPARVSSKEYQDTYRNLLTYLNSANQAIDYLHLDLPINVIESRANNLSYESVVDIQNYVKSVLGLRFGLFVTDRQGGVMSSDEFSQRVLKGIDNFVLAGMNPDAYVLSAWFRFPQYSAPDDTTLASPTQLSTFRALDQRLNYRGDFNAKRCFYDVMRTQEDGAADYEFMGYNLSDGRKEWLFRSACFPNEGLKPLYYCSNEENDAFISEYEHCENNSVSPALLVGYVNETSSNMTAPIYRCELNQRFIITSSRSECGDNPTVSILGYSY